MKSMPTAVRLLSQRIDVTMEPDLQIVHMHDNAGDPMMQSVYGSWSSSESVIKIDTNQGFERMHETFLHENLHAMVQVAQIDRMCDGAGLSEEAVVSALAPILLAWLRDNPKAVAYITEVQP